MHLDRLVTLDYVAAHVGKQGQQYAYSLRFDGDADSAQVQLSGLGMALTEPPADVSTSRGQGATSRGKPATSRGSEANFAGGSRGLRGGVAAPSRGAETTRNASNGAGSGVLKAAMPEKARSGTSKLNGHANDGH